MRSSASTTPSVARTSSRKARKERSRCPSRNPAGRARPSRSSAHATTACMEPPLNRAAASSAVIGSPAEERDSASTRVPGRSLSTSTPSQSQITRRGSMGGR